MSLLNNKNEKYSGLSLVEMLITVLIVGFVLVIVSSTLVSLIKASAISAARTLSRNEAQYIENQLEKYIANSQAENIWVYSVSGTRYISEDTGIVVMEDDFALTSLGIDSPDSGTEIQFRPVGSDEVICIGFVPSENTVDDENIGYIVKSQAGGPGRGCLVNMENQVVMNASEIDIEEEVFGIQSYSSPSGNITYVIDMALKPTYWVPGKQSQFKPEYYKQIVISTRLLTYY